MRTLNLLLSVLYCGMAALPAEASELDIPDPPIDQVETGPAQIFLTRKLLIQDGKMIEVIVKAGEELEVEKVGGSVKLRIAEWM